MWAGIPFPVSSASFPASKSRLLAGDRDVLHLTYGNLLKCPITMSIITQQSNASRNSGGLLEAGFAVSRLWCSVQPGTGTECAYELKRCNVM